MIQSTYTYCNQTIHVSNVPLYSRPVVPKDEELYLRTNVTVVSSVHTIVCVFCVHHGQVGGSPSRLGLFVRVYVRQNIHPWHRASYGLWDLHDASTQNYPILFSIY